MDSGCCTLLIKSLGGVSKIGFGELPLTISASSELGIFRSMLMEDRRFDLVVMGA